MCCAEPKEHKHFLKVGRLQRDFCTKDFFVELRIFLRKMLRNFPRNVWAFVLWVRKNPGKFPPNFPLTFPNFPAKNQKKSPTSFCRSGGRTFSSGYPAGSIGDRGDQEIVYLPNVYGPSLGPRSRSGPTIASPNRAGLRTLFGSQGLT